MKKILFLLAFTGLVILQSCKDEEPEYKANAEVISFTKDKCTCCWGWDIRMEDKTIHTADASVADVVGEEINSPVSVYVELGDIDNNCTNFAGDIEHYSIKKIALPNK